MTSILSSSPLVRFQLQNVWPRAPWQPSTAQPSPGEELCFDYAMTDSDDYDTFKCGCGSARCRGEITGDDWKQPELRDRYAGWYSTYLARRLS